MEFNLYLFIFDFILLSHQSIIILLLDLITDKNSLKGKKIVTFGEYGKFFDPYGAIISFDENIGNYLDVRNWLDNFSIDGTVHLT
jgi:hypothetical protein